jgi:hypothetical protein
MCPIDRYDADNRVAGAKSGLRCCTASAGRPMVYEPMNATHRDQWPTRATKPWHMRFKRYAFNFFFR